MATETTPNNLLDGVAEKDLAVTDSVTGAHTNLPFAQTSLEQTQKSASTSGQPISGQPPQTSAWNASEILLGMGVVLFGGLAIALIVFWVRQRWKRKRVAACLAQLVSGQQRADSLGIDEPWFRKALVQELQKNFALESNEQNRARILEGLYVLAANASDKTGIKVADVARLSFGDSSAMVRQVIVDRIFRDPSPVAEKLFAERRVVEPDPNVKASITDGLIRARLPGLQEVKSTGRFERANEIVRELETLGWNGELAASEIAVLARMQQEAWELERRSKDEEIRRTAARLAKQAAEAIANNDCDAAEEMAKKALGQFPQDELARNMLRDLPQLRRELNEAEVARHIARRQTEAVERRQEAERFLKDQEYEAASKALLALRTLDPIDSWATQNLENLPGLQAHKRRLEEQEALNERTKRIRSLRGLVDKKWNCKNFEEAEKAVHELISLEPLEEGHKALLSKVTEARRVELANLLHSQAEEAIRGGRFDLADEKLRDLLLAEPEASRAKSLSDQLSTLRQMHSDAKGRRLEARRQHLAEGWKRKAHALLTAGKLEEARKAANKFAANSTDGSAVSAIMAQIEDATRRAAANKIADQVSTMLKTGDLDEGERTLRSLLPYEDSPARIENALKSFALLRAQRTEADQRDVETQKKEDVGRMRKNVMSFMREAEFDKAESELRAILAVFPDEGLQRLLTDMPEVRRKHQASTDAASEVESLAKAQKTFEKAQELFATGRFDESAKSLRKTIALDPSNDRAAKLLRRAHEFDNLPSIPAPAPRTKLDSYGQIVDSGQS